MKYDGHFCFLCSNFSHWINRFSMPNHKETDNMYYSVNLGPIHFVSISTEYYSYPQYYTNTHTKQQYDWITQDLAVCNKARSTYETVFSLSSFNFTFLHI